jgi:hypothetical protein
VFNPIGGPGDDLCVPDPTNLPSTCTAASLNQTLTEDVPIMPVLAGPPQEITNPLATEAADSPFTGIDFVTSAFVRGPVQPGAALYVLEGDFGFSASNATEPAHEVGHEVKVINFSRPGKPLEVSIMNFAHNNTFDQAFVSGIHGLNRPTNVRMGPDSCAWIVDYGAVRDFGQSAMHPRLARGNGLVSPSLRVVLRADDLDPVLPRQAGEPGPGPEEAAGRQLCLGEAPGGPLIDTAGSCISGRWGEGNRAIIQTFC